MKSTYYIAVVHKDNPDKYSIESDPYETYEQALSEATENLPNDLAKEHYVRILKMSTEDITPENIRFIEGKGAYNFNWRY